MKQAQEIAIASQYHDRAATAVEFFSSQFIPANLPNWGRGTGRVPTPDVPIEELGRRWLIGASYLTMADNSYYQYQTGFLDDESWQTQRATLKRNLSNPESPVHVALGSINATYRISFLELCETLIAESQIESS